MYYRNIHVILIFFSNLKRICSPPLTGVQVIKSNWNCLASLLYPPQTKLRGYIVILMSVRSFVRQPVHPSQSLIRYSSKTAEQNFMKLSGIVHYTMPYCISYFKILGFPRTKQGLCHTKHGGAGGYHFVSIAHSISSFNEIFDLHFVIFKKEPLNMSILTKFDTVLNVCSCNLSLNINLSTYWCLSAIMLHFILIQTLDTYTCTFYHSIIDFHSSQQKHLSCIIILDCSLTSIF